MLLLGIGFLIVGFGFKVAAVPFHVWTPDVYEGAPTSVTALMAVGVKAAAFAAFARVFLDSLAATSADWNTVLWWLAAATMTVGNVLAIAQSNIKRMLAYSSIAHAGYLLVAMVAGGTAGGAALLFYLLAYAATNLGAFGVVIALATSRRAERIDRALCGTRLSPAAAGDGDGGVHAVARRCSAARRVSPASSTCFARRWIAGSWAWR